MSLSTYQVNGRTWYGIKGRHQSPSDYHDVGRSPWASWSREKSPSRYGMVWYVSVSVSVCAHLPSHQRNSHEIRARSNNLVGPDQSPSDYHGGSPGASWTAAPAAGGFAGAQPDNCPA